MTEEIADEARAALRRHVLAPLAPRCVDRAHGGFLVDFDERWRPAGPQEKTLEHASRTTIAFALADRELPGEGFGDLARHGCAFLQQAMWDTEHGGFYARVDRSGRPGWDGLKHPHAVTYAAQAFLLAAPLLAPGEGQAWADRALAWLDDVAWDPAHGGYWGSYRRDNARYPEGARLPTPDGLDVLGQPQRFKEINTQGDAIETLTLVLAHGAGARHPERLRWLVALVTERLGDAEGILPYLYRRDWRPVPDLIRVGQNFQMAHRLVAASAAIGDTGPVARACGIVDFCLDTARHPAGGFCFAVAAGGRTFPATGPGSDLRQWWVQIEAVHALHVLARHPFVTDASRARYRRTRDEQWAFVRDRYFDEKFGGLRESVDEPRLRWHRRLRHAVRQALRPRPQLKTHGWKDPFHEVSAFIALGHPYAAASTAHSPQPAPVPLPAP